MSHIFSFGCLLGRLCISAIFILAGVGKFVDYDETVQYMAANGLTVIPLLLVVAALVEIVGGLSILIGYRTRWGAALLILFLIPTTFIFHNFWDLDDVERQMQMVEFMKNLAILGGLLYVVCVGAGRYSVDTCCHSCKPQTQ